MYMMIGIVIILCIILMVVAEDKTLTFMSLLFIVICSFFVGVEINATLDKKKEQPKYKQEIVYSLKDGKYLPTDTIYTEIK